MKFCGKFAETLRKIWWNFGRKWIKFCGKFGEKLWERFGEILRTIWVRFGEQFGEKKIDEILERIRRNVENTLVKSWEKFWKKKNWWSFVENLMKLWEKFGDVLEKNWWSSGKNLVKSWEQFCEKFGKILRTVRDIQWNFVISLVKLGIWKMSVRSQFSPLNSHISDGSQMSLKWVIDGSHMSHGMSYKWVTDFSWLCLISVIHGSHMNHDICPLRPSWIKRFNY